MPAIIIYLLLIAVEVFFFVMRVKTGNELKKERCIYSIALFALSIILMVTGVMPFGIRWAVLHVVIWIRFFVNMIILAVITGKKKADSECTVARGVGKLIGRIIGITAACVFAFIFPEFHTVPPTGSHPFETVSYTWEDTNRVETFTSTGENRKVTVEFWYPTDAKQDEEYPLVIFSHGAYGFRGASTSTFEDLASNGYVVCSIDHTYHSFMTEQTDGKVIIVDNKFLQEVAITNSPDRTEEVDFNITSAWLKLRTDDMNFVIDQILDKVDGNRSEDDLEQLYSEIDATKIGVFGHSLGGATAAEIGRQRDDISAVIDVDGSMTGEELNAKGNDVVIDETPYPIPLLNIYAEYHYTMSRIIGDQYMNCIATKNGVDAMETVIWGAEHLNYSDLPLFCPLIGKMMGYMGTGSIDSRQCIEILDEIVLNYFNHYLKGSEDLHIAKEYRAN